MRCLSTLLGTALQSDGSKRALQSAPMRAVSGRGISAKPTHHTASEINAGLFPGPTQQFLAGSQALRETLQRQREQAEVKKGSLVPLRVSLPGVEKVSHLTFSTPGEILRIYVGNP